MEAVEAYAKVGIAVTDAFIACWDTKYRYNLLRPVTYIRDQIDPTWLPLLATPPFPEYTSGHSVQSGAAFYVLADVFGENSAFTDRTHEDRGLPPRRFDSFDAAAREAAISRLYGGIHYRPALERGLAQGRCIGEAVTRLPFQRRVETKLDRDR
jgi:membrane-associated phospholipid phosphatase